MYVSSGAAALPPPDQAGGLPIENWYALCIEIVKGIDDPDERAEWERWADQQLRRRVPAPRLMGRACARPGYMIPFDVGDLVDPKIARREARREAAARLRRQ